MRKLGAYLILFVGVILIANAQTNVEIPDSNFRNALAILKNNEGLPLLDIEGKLITERAAKTTNVTISSQGVKDLSGIEYFTGIARLTIFENEIEDLSPVAELPQLHYFFITKNKITSIDAILGFSMLQEIRIGNNPLGDTEIAKIVNGNFPKARYLDFSNCGLTQMPNFSNFPVLERLHIFNNDIPNSTLDLSTNTKLKTLYAQNVGITNIEGLANLPDLYWLELNDNNLTDISAINAPKLYRLRADRNPITKIFDLNLHPKIEILSIFPSSANIDNITTIDMSVHPKMYQFAIQSTSLEEVTGLSNHETLYQFYVINSKITNVDDLSTCANLKLIHLYNNQLTSIPQVTPNIVSFYLQENNLNFDDFEANAQYFVPMSNRVISPQNIVGVDTIVSAYTGESFLFSYDLGGQNTTYQWYKDGVVLSDQTSKELNFSTLTETDSGVYFVRGTNPSAPNLTLESAKLTLTLGATAEIPDANLRAHLNSLFADPNAPLFTESGRLILENAPRVKYISCNDCGIEDLTGIEYLTEITSIRLIGTDVTAIDGKGALTKLTRLDIFDGGKLEILQGFENATLIEALNVSNNQLTQIPDVSNYINLKSLYLSQNPIQDTVLDVSNNKLSFVLDVRNLGLTDIIGLENTEMTRAWLNGNRLTNVSGLANLSTLTEVHLYNNNISVLPDLSQNTNMFALWIHGNPLQIGELDVTPFPVLRQISAANCGITVINGLANLNFSYFHINNNPISDITGIENSHDVFNFGIAYTNITELPDLSNFPNWKFVDLAGVSLKDTVLDVSNNTALVDFRLTDIGLTEVVGLDKLVNITYLYLGKNNLTSVEGLSNCIKLRTLDLRSNELTSLPDLSNCLSLTNFNASFNKLTFDDFRNVPFTLPLIAYQGQGKLGTPDTIYVSEGDTIQYVINAGTDAKNTYKWYKEPDFLYEGSSTLMIPNATLADTGAYILKVENVDFLGLQLRSEYIVVKANPYEPLVIDSVNTTLNQWGYNLNCFADNNASATVTFSKGEAPFSISWSNGDTSATATNLSVGEYTVIITDSYGTSVSQIITITQPEQLSLSVEATNAVCEGEENASIMLTANGGVGNFDYHLNGETSNAIIENLGAETYQVGVTDIAGCTTYQTVNISALSLPSIVIYGNDQTYHGYKPTECTVLEVDASEGSNVVWNTGEITPQIEVCPNETTLYSVIATDTNGCINSASHLVNAIDVSCGKRGKKVIMCRKIRPRRCYGEARYISICVNKNTVEKRLKRGVKLGACNASDVDIITTFDAIAYPNSIIDYSTLYFNLLEDSYVTIQLLDQNSQLLEIYSTGEKIMNSGEYEFGIDVTNSISSYYFIQITVNNGTDSISKVIRLMKE